MESRRNKGHIRRGAGAAAGEAQERLLGPAVYTQPAGSSRDPGDLLLRYGGTVGALALVTAVLWPFRADVGLLNTALVYEIAVVAATVFAGQRAGVLAAVLGFLLFDFFLVPPYLTFVIGDLSNILALFVFLGFSLLLSWLIAGAREQAEQARRRAEDIAQLYDLAKQLVGARDVGDVLVATAGKVAAAFGAGVCWLLLPNEGLLAVRAAAPQGARMPTRDELSLAAWAYDHGSEVGQVGDRAVAGGRAIFVPLRSGGRIAGVLGIADKTNDHPFVAAERIALATFADQAAAALERLALLRDAQRAEVLQRTDELKTALLSAVSHDLRTPLASTMAMVTGLLDRGIEWDEASRREFLESIYDELRRLNRLVGNLLDMSRIEGGALHPEKHWYAVDEVIEAVARRLQPALQASGHELTLDLAPGLPMTPFDFTEIDQVLTNLLENAIKYTPAATPIRISARATATEIEVQVADSGPGVDAADLPHLFDKFYRVESDRRAGKQGTGLGLAITRGLIEAHGGRIWARSGPGQGLAVSFTLPLLNGASEAVAGAGAAQEGRIG